MLHLFYYRDLKRFKFTDIHLACILSAHTNGKFQKIVLHEDTPGDTSAYIEARKLPYVEFRKTEFPTHINGYRISDQKLSLDLIRLQTLIAEGGVVSDLDFIFLKDFSPILEHEGFIGTQCKQKKKLSCALMYSKEPQNPFFIEYLEAYKTWIPEHEKKFWTQVNTIPYELSEKLPTIKILPMKAFFPVACSNKTFLQGQNIPISESYAVNLWCRLKPHLTLQDIDKTVIKSFLPELKPSILLLEGVTLTFD